MSVVIWLDSSCGWALATWCWQCGSGRPHAVARSASRLASTRISLPGHGRRFSAANTPGSCVVSFPCEISFPCGLPSLRWLRFIAALPCGPAFSAALPVSRTLPHPWSPGTPLRYYDQIGFPSLFSANLPSIFCWFFGGWWGVRAGMRRCSSPVTRLNGSGWISAGGATRSATARCCLIRRARSGAGARPSASSIPRPRRSRSAQEIFVISFLFTESGAHSALILISFVSWCFSLMQMNARIWRWRSWRRRGTELSPWQQSRSVFQNSKSDPRVGVYRVFFLLLQSSLVMPARMHIMWFHGFCLAVT
jgi:hypothetical protein